MIVSIVSEIKEGFIWTSSKKCDINKQSMPEP